MGSFLGDSEYTIFTVMPRNAVLSLALREEVRVIYLDMEEYIHVGGNLIIKLFCDNSHHCFLQLLTHLLNHVSKIINDCLVEKH